MQRAQLGSTESTSRNCIDSRLSHAPRSFAEYMVISLMMFVGSIAWAWVIGSLCAILSTLNPHETKFRNR